MPTRPDPPVTGPELPHPSCADPIGDFRAWFSHAEASGIELPEAMALATADPDGSPSVRIVLLKRFDERGFVFFTNLGSRKAAELDRNPRAALCLHWATLERQVRACGRIERVSVAETAAYFGTRPRGSRIGAWASRQSQVLAERGELERRVAEAEVRFEGRDIPLPPHWGGYRLVLDEIEFWLGRGDRLHDRVRFTRTSSSPWRGERLYP